MPKISVIVPVYNTEKYLHRCIDSILAQTFADFEVLLINDGSTDSSGEICDEYAQKDSRVRVFHKENGGVSSARNIGIDNAQGVWITFVDSDDWVEPKFMELSCEKDDFDLIICYYNAIGWKEWIATPPQNQIFHTNDLKHSISNNILSWNTPWCKMFKNEIVKKNCCRFNIGVNLGEDTLFVYDYLKYISSISISSEILYNYNSLPALSLSKKRMTWNELSISLNLILSSVNELEYLYKINLQDCKDYFIRYYVKKSLNNCTSYRDIIAVLRHMHDNENVSSLVQRHKLFSNKAKVLEILFNKHIDWFFALFVYLKFAKR